MTLKKGVQMCVPLTKSFMQEFKLGERGGGKTYKAQIVSGGMPLENYFYFLCG